MQVASACQPLLNLLQEEILAGKYINIDETTVQVLKEPGRDPTTQSYMWVYRRGDPHKQVLLYQYHPTRCAEVVRDFLEGYQGCVQSDGYAGYDFLDKQEGVRHIGCLAHARRKFADIVKAQGKNAKSRSAHKAVSFFKKLYKVEKECRVANLSAQETYLRRQEQSKPIVDDFKEWLDKKKLQTPPKGKMGQAVAYNLNQWHRLIGYLEDGRYSPDNNAAENSIRPFVIGRKNWLFSGTPEGAQASAALYSLIETAKANKVEPYSYLRHIFEELPKAETLEDYQVLLPWNVQLGRIAE
jgi:transposase